MEFTTDAGRKIRIEDRDHENEIEIIIINRWHDEINFYITLAEAKIIVEHLQKQISQ